MASILKALAVLLIPFAVEGLLIWGAFRVKNRFIKIPMRCLALLILPILCCTTTLTIPYIYNQYNRLQFQEAFYDYPLPPDTIEIERNSRVDNLTVNGTWDHCAFLVNRIVQTSLSEDELEAYYENVLFPPVHNNSSMVFIVGKDGKLTVTIYFDDPRSGLTRLELFDGWYQDTFSILDPRCWSQP